MSNYLNTDILFNFAYISIFFDDSISMYKFRLDKTIIHLHRSLDVQDFIKLLE